MKSPYTFFTEARHALAAVRAANTEDLKEYPGKRGERAHKRLHRETGKLLKGQLSKTGAVGVSEATKAKTKAVPVRTVKLTPIGAAMRKWEREVAMLSARARSGDTQTVRKCAHAVATRELLDAGSFLLDPYFSGHEYWSSVVAYAYFSDMARALARGDGYSRKYPAGRLPSGLVFPVPSGHPLRVDEPAVPKPSQFTKSVQTDIREVDLDEEFFNPTGF